MRLALCDTTVADLDILAALIQKFCTKHILPVQIDCFTSGEALLASTASYDIIFIDIFLGKMAGTDVVRALSKTASPLVVFVTSSERHAIEAFHLNAVHYLVKPVPYAALAEAMSRSLSRISKACNQILKIKSRQAVIPISMSNIIYIEVLNKISIIHTRKNTFRAYMPLRVLFERLDKQYFMKAQRSYIVNMNFIDTLHANRLVLHNGIEIMLSRSNRVALKEQYQKFLLQLAQEQH